LPPGQSVVLPAGVITAAGLLTVTATGVEMAVQVLRLVTVTVYDPASAALIVWVVSPFDHRYADPIFADKETWLPGQIVVLPPGVIWAVPVLTIMLTGAETVSQPAAFVTVTVKEPAAEEVMLCEVAPVDHRYVEPAFAVSVTLPPWQKVVGPDGVMDAEAGVVVTETGTDTAVQLSAFVTVTVYVLLPDPVMDAAVDPSDH